MDPFRTPSSARLNHSRSCGRRVTRRLSVEALEVRFVPALHPLSAVPILHSNPGAAARLVLDFNGHTEHGYDRTEFHTIVTPAYDLDGLPNSFSDGELTNIREIWRRVSQDYLPFNLDVTTDQSGSFANRAGLRIAIGGSYTDWYGRPAGGVTLGGTGNFYNSLPNVAFVFAKGRSGGEPKPVADAVAHEAGHAFGLEHQSAFNTDGTLAAEYSDNDGSNALAPIMGNPDSAAFSAWWTGPTPDGHIQDDMAILSGSNNGFGYRYAGPFVFANGEEARFLSVKATQVFGAWKLFALDRSGRLLQYDPRAGWSVIDDAVSAFDVTRGGTLYLRRDDGNVFVYEQGQFYLQIEDTISFALNGDRVMALKNDGNLYAFSFGQPVVQQVTEVQSFAVGQNGRVFFLAYDGDLYAFSEGAPVLRQVSGVQSFAVGEKGRVFYLGYDGDLYAFGEHQAILRQASGVQSFAVGDGNRVYFLAKNGNLYAFSERKPILYQARDVASFAVGDGNRVYYLGTNGNIYAFNEWEPIQPIAVGARSFALGAGGRIFYLSRNGNIYAFGEGFPIEMQAPAVSSFALGAGNRVFYQSTAGDIYAFSENKPIVMQAQGARSFALGAGNRVFFQGSQGNLYAFNEHGPIEMQAGDVSSFAVGGGDRVFYLSSGGNIYAFTKGSPIQMQATDVASFALGGGNRVFYQGQQQNIYAFSETKPIVMQVGAVRSFAVGAGNRVYYHSTNGNVYAFSEGKPVVMQMANVQSFALGDGNRFYYLKNGNIYGATEGKAPIMQAPAVQSFALGAGNRVFYLSTNGALFTFFEGYSRDLIAGAVEYTLHEDGITLDFVGLDGRPHRLQNGLILY